MNEIARWSRSGEKRPSRVPSRSRRAEAFPLEDPLQGTRPVQDDVEAQERSPSLKRTTTRLGRDDR